MKKKIFFTLIIFLGLLLSIFYIDSVNFEDTSYLLTKKYNDFNFINTISITENKAVIPFTNDKLNGYVVLNRNFLNRWSIERVVERVTAPIIADTIKTSNDISYSIIITNNIPKGTIVAAYSDLNSFQHTFVNNNSIMDISIKVINSRDIENYDFYVNSVELILNDDDITSDYIKNNQIPYMHMVY